MNDHIGAAIAAASAQPQADATPEATQATPETAETQPNEAQPIENKVEEVFPKKAVNALSRRDKTIGRLKAEKEQLLAEIAKHREQPTQKQPENNPSGIPKTLPNGEPNLEAYENYHDYMRDLARHDFRKEMEERENKSKETQKDQAKEAWRDERKAALEETTREFAKETPEIVAFVQEYSDLLDNMPQEIDDLFLEAENGTLAFYNLAKEGKLEALMSMSPARAAMEIGRAQTQAPTKPKTKAPTPLPAHRGSVPAGKQPRDFSPREALEFLTKKE